MTGDISSLLPPLNRLAQILEKFYELALYSTAAADRGSVPAREWDRINREDTEYRRRNNGE